jgi:hypothetical protein
MNEPDQKLIEQLLKKSLPRLGDRAGAELRGDLWPAMLRRLDAPRSTVPWLDWALLGTVTAWLAFFPGAIPVLLYHL